MSLGNTVSIDALRPELWEAMLFEDMIDNLVFEKLGLMGSSENFIVQFKDDLMVKKGDGINIGLTVKLSGDGVTGDSDLEGNEEIVSAYAERIAVDQIRNAARTTGAYDEQINMFDMRKDNKDKLAIWFAEFMENQIFMKAGGVNTITLTDVNGTTYSARARWSNIPTMVPAADEVAATGNRYIGAESTGFASIAAADVLTPRLIQRAKTKARFGNPKLRPMVINGKPHFVMFIHPWVADDLRLDTTYNTAQSTAKLRGDDNPLFTGALGMWSDVILHDHEYVPSAQANSAFATGGTTNASVRVFRNLLMGCQAVAFARSKVQNGGFVEKTFDYGNQVGHAGSAIGGLDKVMFNSKEYGVIAVDTGATAQ